MDIMASARTNESSCPAVILYHSNSALRSVNMKEAPRAPTSIICLQTALQCSQSIHHIDLFSLFLDSSKATYDKLLVLWWMRGSTATGKFLFLFISVCMHLHKSWCGAFARSEDEEEEADASSATFQKRPMVGTRRAVMSSPAFLTKFCSKFQTRWDKKTLFSSGFRLVSMALTWFVSWGSKGTGQRGHPGPPTCFSKSFLHFPISVF